MNPQNQKKGTQKTAPQKIGTLFIVATPIGNLGDITVRAIEILGEVEVILAEDTRHARILLRHLSIPTPTKSLHQHNEAARLPWLLRRLGDGAQIALISDAGTPLISDPGYRLVQHARQAGIAVTPVPGASAAIAALSAAGQPAEGFCFEGFLPAKSAARKRRLHALRAERRTMIFYEASHRIAPMLAAVAAAFGDQRPVTLAREISKKFETFYYGTAAEVSATVAGDAHHRKGEFVLVVCGAGGAPLKNEMANDSANDSDHDSERASARAFAEKMMICLMAEMPLKRASQIAAQILDRNPNELYALGLALKNSR